MNPDLLYEVAPLFKQDLSSVVVDVGGTAVFTCRVCGRPRPTVTWHGPNKTELVGGPRVALSYSEDGEATLKVRKGVRVVTWGEVRKDLPSSPAILVFLLFLSSPAILVFLLFLSSPAILVFLLFLSSSDPSFPTFSKLSSDPGFPTFSMLFCPVKVFLVFLKIS